MSFPAFLLAAAKAELAIKSSGFTSELGSSSLS
jgi:hypothetical protein